MKYYLPILRTIWAFLERTSNEGGKLIVGPERGISESFTNCLELSALDGFYSYASGNNPMFFVPKHTRQRKVQFSQQYAENYIINENTPEDVDDDVSLSALSTRRTTKTARTARERVVASASVPLAQPVAHTVTAISIAFNTAIMERHLRYPEYVSINNFYSVFSNLVKAVKTRNGLEDRLPEDFQVDGGQGAVPLLAVLTVGQGKCKCIQEVAVFPKTRPPSSEEATDTFSKLYFEKLEPPIIDRPEQAIEFVLDLLQQRDVEGEFSIAVVCEPYAHFNETRGKYEPTKGAFKSAQEMVAVYVGLLSAYPQVRMLTNPFRTEDTDAWFGLQQCLVENDALVKLCSSSRAWRVDSGFRLTSAPTISELARLLHGTSPSNEESVERRSFDASDVIGLNAFEVQTDCCLILDVVEAVLFAKCKKKQVTFDLPRDSSIGVNNELTLAVALAVGADYINFGNVHSVLQRGELAKWIDVVYDDQLLV
ncbi:unnamed protein product [Mesocestoides corti]|uniref:Phosphopyruvate hydratase n=2 Tax=Mesocestoides corti TaxID=53468 RepID=A0A158QVE0_MESCO|nr:unnamed protein product [Mesocestoides corti]